MRASRPASDLLTSRRVAASQPADDGSGWRSVQAVCASLPQAQRAEHGMAAQHTPLAPLQCCCCAMPQAAAAVDMRALVQFALLNGLLTRIEVLASRRRSPPPAFPPSPAAQRPCGA